MNDQNGSGDRCVASHQILTRENPKLEFTNDEEVISHNFATTISDQKFSKINTECLSIERRPHIIRERNLAALTDLMMSTQPTNFKIEYN